MARKRTRTSSSHVMDIGEEETDDGLEPEYRHIVRPAVQPLREDGDRQARSPGIDPSDGPTYLLTQRSTAHLITQQSSQQGQRPPKYCCPSLCGPKRIICCVVCCWLLPFILAGLGVAGFYLYPRTNIDVHIGSFRQHITHYDATAAVLPTFAVTLLTTLNISNPNYVPFTLTSIQLKVWYVARPAAGVAAAAVSLNPATSGISTGVPLVIINSASDIVVPAGTPDAPQHKTFLVKVSLSTNNGTCNLQAQISVQPVYLSLGQGIIPPQVFSIPVSLSKPPPLTPAPAFGSERMLQVLDDTATSDGSLLFMSEGDVESEESAGKRLRASISGDR